VDMCTLVIFRMAKSMERVFFHALREIVTKANIVKAKCMARDVTYGPLEIVMKGALKITFVMVMVK